MSISTGENAVSVNAGSQLLLRYPYNNVPFKPYVQQLFSPAGVNILRDAPADHLHHHALMFAVKVDGVNFWEETPTAGKQLHKSFTDVKTDTKTDVENDKSLDMRNAGFTELIDWTNPKRELLLKERRTIDVCQGTDLGATLLTWQSRFELPEGTESATLTGSHYHGLGMRFLKSMDVGGRFINADNKTGTVFRGEERLLRSTWCAYTANADGKPVTIAMFDHPQNPRYPATWFTMTAPFAYLSATMNLHVEPIKVAAGKPLVLRYAVAVWDGKVENDRIDKLYQHWTSK
ncbi:MAG: PmoA family protein [Phycisphaerae bacterium]|nr:PmoA family protein [Phycisphaerae bacterium]